MKHKIHDLPLNKILVAPSILAADFADMGRQVEAVEHAGCDLLHLDVMDGHFVPNLTFGPAMVSAIRKHSNLLFDAHLMISHPIQYAKIFSDAGADHITFHVESDDDPLETIRAIKATGCTVGVSVKPKTPASAIKDLLPEIDLVLVMTVEPGFGGQSFMHDQVPKVAEIFAMLKEINSKACIQVDGGIDSVTAPEIVSAGADMLVAGTSVFRAKNGMENAIAALHDCVRLLPVR